MDPTRNPAPDPEFDIDAWERWQQAKHAWLAIYRQRCLAAVQAPRPYTREAAAQGAACPLPASASGS
ncbi:hypothetical protein [Hymenobacter sp. DG25A]|uniref:hypothetical protein n=1 Tax=Hymenobacter sp. DG25A TaxID=1385663 RepID=UPI0006BCFFDE|nr:hypothetical protein [Hymenobacter sp. DG25A]ALD19927.1 hypothetical protein AM218_00095 [Hymenobacter sp. DG25A]